jgi:hypothetical protein
MSSSRDTGSGQRDRECIVIAHGDTMVAAPDAQTRSAVRLTYPGCLDVT